MKREDFSGNPRERVVPPEVETIDYSEKEDGGLSGVFVCYEPVERGDPFIECALSVIECCDEVVLAVSKQSSDGTEEYLRSLAEEHDNVFVEVVDDSDAPTLFTGDRYYGQDLNEIRYGINKALEKRSYKDVLLVQQDEFITPATRQKIRSIDEEGNGFMHRHDVVKGNWIGVEGFEESNFMARLVKGRDKVWTHTDASGLNSSPDKCFDTGLEFLHLYRFFDLDVKDSVLEKPMRMRKGNYHDRVTSQVYEEMSEMDIMNLNELVEDGEYRVRGYTVEEITK